MRNIILIILLAICSFGFTFDGLDDGSGLPAERITVNADSHDGVLSPLDDTVQKALDTIDDYSPDLSAYWKSDGTSTATGDWTLGTYDLTAQIITANNSMVAPYVGLSTDEDLISLADGAVTVNGTIGATNVSGTNTGDQDLSGYALLSGADFTGAISATNLSGTNTGDQTLPTRDSLGLDTDDTVTFANLSGTNTGDRNSRQITAIIGGAGEAIVASTATPPIRIPYSGTITAWRVTADASSSCVIDVWKDTYANYPPTVADTITGSEKPTLSSSTKNEDTSLTTWTTSVTAGDYVTFSVDSCSTATKVTVALSVTASN